ncbi:MAG: hypothetical protein IPL11_13505 [Candidatus Accumulibacter sp.]|nr:hypothetical protein [Accumulibacter sp.]
MAKSQLRGNREAKKPKQPQKTHGTCSTVRWRIVERRLTGIRRQEEVIKAGSRCGDDGEPRLMPWPPCWPRFADIDLDQRL